jgi:hypothetical protein
MQKGKNKRSVLDERTLSVKVSEAFPDEQINSSPLSCFVTAPNDK